MLLHHLPLSRPAYMDLPQWHWAWPSSAPSAGWATSAGDQQGWGWVPGAECPGSLLWKPKCGVLLPRWGLACPVTRCHLICTHTRSTGAVLLSRGTLTWSQVLSAVLCESFCGERKSPPPVGDRNIGNSAFMAGSQKRWRNLVRLTKILRADYDSEWNQECLAHLLVYFEEPSKCQFSSGFM